MDNDKEMLYKPPYWIDLTPKGQTVFYIYAHELQEKIAEKIIDELGEPELCGHIEGSPTLTLLYPHQNLPDDLKDLAERMTTQSLLDWLDPLKNLLAIKVTDLDDVNHELSEYTIIIVDMRLLPEPGKLVFGWYNDKPAAWRFHEWDDKNQVIGRVTQAQYFFQCL